MSLLIFSPFGDYQKLLNSAVAALGFGSNLYYMLQDSYVALRLDPYRHFWSLAIEEQFYLLFFIWLVLLAKFPKRKKSALTASNLSFKTLILFVAIVAILAGICLYWVPSDLRYFSPVCRSWQLLAGVVLGAWNFLRPSHLSVPMSRLMRSCGIIGLIITLYEVQSPNDWPSTWAVGITLSTLLILHGGSSNAYSRESVSWVRKSVIRVGDLSYEIYLVHWPIIVFIEKVWPDVVIFRALSFFLVYLCALTLNSVSRKFLWENISQRPKARVVLAFGGMFFVCGLILFSGLRLSNTRLGLQQLGFDAEDSTWTIGNSDLKTFEKRQSFATTHGCPDAVEASSVMCLIPSGRGERAPEIVLVGDSQARALSDGVVDANDGAANLYISWASGCPFTIEGYPYSRDECLQLNSSRLQQIRDLSPSIIVISNLASRYVGSDLQFVTTNSDSTRTDAVIKRYVLAQMETIQYLLSLGSQIVFVTDIPLPPKDAGSPSLIRPNLERYFLRKDSLVGKAIIEGLGRVESNRLTVVRPENYLCDGERCSLFQDGYMNFSDDDHLSVAGSKLQAPALSVTFKSQFINLN